MIRIDVKINERDLYIISKYPNFVSIENYPPNDLFKKFELGKMQICEYTYIHFILESKEKQQIIIENLIEDVEILLQDSLSKLQQIKKDNQ